MDELEIMYLGKKGDVKISPRYLPEPLHFPGHGHKAVLREDLATRLMTDNPKMFMVTRRLIPEVAPLDPEATEALFSDEGLEGVAEQEKDPEKPPERMNKKDLAVYALEEHELVLDPDGMTKKEMLAAIDEKQE